MTTPTGSTPDAEPARPRPPLTSSALPGGHEPWPVSTVGPDATAGAVGSGGSVTGHTRRRGAARPSSGAIVLGIGVVLLLVLGLTPSPYAIRQPGPVFNAIGEVTLAEGAAPTDVITITGAQVYPTGSGRLDVMTVNIAGNPTQQPSWFEAFLAFLDPSRDVLPVELYYPSGETVDQRDQQNRALMQSSQDEAIASALREQGYEVPVQVVLTGVSEDGPSAGLLQAGDIVRRVGDQDITSADVLRDSIADHDGTTPVSVTVERDGTPVTVDVVPTEAEVEGQLRPVFGITVGSTYDFPVQVHIELGDVGGPSAGLIFTLAIIDELTPGDLTGGHHIAGTGTMTADGVVGPIGGVRQKLFAAQAAGAEAFLVPVDNCAEALDGGVPGDLPLYAVSDLDDGLAAVEAIASGAGQGNLPSCASVATTPVP
ncbi:PDZ domain-containing protein [Pseudoclavibacter chungangensis]|uniref:YlbL family protein n=1 Tax=Pseudoclavibacter chungangensis TaxID=587635 RepID=UPI0015CE4C37|nr:S16 family serine protease [Pseudoclavibacter chungangensis]NYJ66129.1 PDZ domain-containing protein [Pseudoclavibacter chungangensis]